MQEIIQKIKKQEYAPIYLLQGTESYLREQFRQTLIEEALGAEADLNFLAIDCEEEFVENGLEEANMMPFFGNHRIVWLENPFFLTAEKKGTAPEHNLASLEEYLKNPISSTILVISANYPKLDERKKLVKLVKKQAVMVDAKKLEGEKALQYVRQYLGETDYVMSAQALDRFAYLCDQDLTKMMSELEKCCLAANSTDKKIGVGLVEDLVPKTLEHNIFDLTQYIFQNKQAQAVELVRELMLQGEEPIKLNAVLLSQVRLFLQTKLLLEKNYQQSHIAELLKVHPYRVKLAIQQVKRQKIQFLGQLFDELIENDLALKSSRMDKGLQMELLLLKIPGMRA